MLGTTLAGRYRIVRLLGRGGMGSVYEAADTTSGSRVAVKLVTAEVLEDAVLIGRFSREARAAMAIETPHVARVVDAGQDQAQRMPFLVMEYLQGEDLRALLRRVGPLPPDTALRIAAQAASGLVAAHARRIIHRDIKPANLFVAEGAAGERTVKIVDFGIAKLQPDPGQRSSEITNLTRTGSMLGSPLFMSPEQARGYRDIDERADVWSLGVVLFQALSGRTPHPGDTPLGDLIVAICTEPPPPIQSIAPWVPPEAALIVQRALQLDPAERFQSAKEMEAALLRLLPGGAALHERMLRPLTDEERAYVAPVATPPSAPGWQTLAGIKSSPGPGSLPPPGAPDQASSLAGLGTAAAPAPRSRRVAAIAIGAALALCAGGAGLYLRSRAAPGADAGIAGASTASAASQAAQDRTVRLAVLPRDAEIEIDGAKAEAVDGIVELRGALGSIHRVRVRAGDAAVVRDVVISESGAMPPAVEAAPGAAPSASAADTPPSAPSASAPAPSQRPAPVSHGPEPATSAAPKPSGTIWLKR